MDSIADAKENGHLQLGDLCCKERRSCPLFVLITVNLVPIVYTIVTSLQSYHLAYPHKRSFIGLGNYIEIFQMIDFGIPYALQFNMSWVAFQSNLYWDSVLLYC